jgi:hypothetical protein
MSCYKSFCVAYALNIDEIMDFPPQVHVVCEILGMAGEMLAVPRGG